MKTSYYNICVDNPDTKETILFNSLYGSLTVCTTREMASINKLLADPNGEFSESKITSIRQTLIDQKNIIMDDIDELEIIRQRKLAGIRDENRLDLIIMPTLDCNFACTYCYETHKPGKMDSRVEDALKAWLNDQVPRFKFVMLHWFGGEPLLGFQQVIAITRHLQELARRSGVEYVFHMTTNGYLLSEKSILALNDCDLFDFQITIDGTATTHDAMRLLKNGQGTFQRLFTNIVRAARIDRRNKITLRVNYNHQNLHTIPQLLESFPDDIRSQLRVTFEPIFGSCEVSATGNLSSQEISQATANDYRIAKNLGYDVVLVGSGLNPGKTVYCYAERTNQYIINYTGDVYKCSVSRFEPEKRVGTLTSTGKLIHEQQNWDAWKDMDLFETQCNSCVFLPLCMGGCRKTRLEKHGTGSFCALVPTNTSYLLKQVAFGNLDQVILRQVQSK